jgi:hypothetical protein
MRGVRKQTLEKFQDTAETDRLHCKNEEPKYTVSIMRANAGRRGDVQ